MLAVLVDQGQTVLICVALKLKQQSFGFEMTFTNGNVKDVDDKLILIKRYGEVRISELFLWYQLTGRTRRKPLGRSVVNSSSPGVYMLGLDSNSQELTHKDRLQCSIYYVPVEFPSRLDSDVSAQVYLWNEFFTTLT